jgi:phage gpG-like protein
MANGSISVTVRGDREVAARFTRLGGRAHSAIVRAINQLRLEDEALVKRKLSGEVLNVRTGALRRSIFSEMLEDSGTRISARIASSGDVKYAAIHEFGGIIQHPGGTAYMMVAGRATFVSNLVAETAAIAGRTRPHAIEMPERSFLRAALKEMVPRIKQVLEQTMAEVAGGA